MAFVEFSFVPYAHVYSPVTAKAHLHHHAGRGMSAAVQSVVPVATTGKPKLYDPRHNGRTLPKCTIAEHFESSFELGVGLAYAVGLQPN